MEHVVGRAPVVIDDRDVLERRDLVAHLEDPLEVVDVLDDRDHGAAVRREVLDLLRRGGVVDRHRCRPEQDGRDVGDVELRPVAHHEDDPLAGDDAEGGQRRREATGPVGVVGPGPLAPAVAFLPAERHPVGMGPDGFAKDGCERPAVVHHLLALLSAGRDTRLHGRLRRLRLHRCREAKPPGTCPAVERFGISVTVPPAGRIVARLADQGNGRVFHRALWMNGGELG